MGRASAVAVMMFVLLALVTLAQLRVFRRTDR
jgi:ABC-type sugar transport system permease subunit